MSEGTKFFVRPKVRFSQNDTSIAVVKELKDSNDENSDVKQLVKPKITNIVKLDKPIKLVKLNKNNQKNKDLKASNNIEETNSSSSLNENYTKPKNQTPLNDASNSHNIKANAKEVTTPKTSKKFSSDDIIVSIPSPVRQTENSSKILKPKNSVAKKNPTKSKKGKENQSDVSKNCTKTTSTRYPDLDILKHKARISSAGTKKINASNNKPVTTKKSSNSKPIDVMPCYKYNKAASKVKTSPIKKTLIRDAVDPKIPKSCIGPGVSRKRLENLKSLHTDENTHAESIVSGEKLARPEYNSIMCTISKLNELKKQKGVTDIEHLPSEYKNLINEKVSSALDFPLDEAIYKNLVDLNVDENQLPGRLTRSKDPEPRQRDIVPVLSDFFTPLSTEEYCTPSSTKPRAPEMMDGWSAFRISDQICKWKHNLDEI